MCGSRQDDPAYLSMQEAAVAALAHVLMEYDAGRIVVEPEPGMAVPPGGKPTRFHRAWADALLTALAADRLALSGITEERLAAAMIECEKRRIEAVSPNLLKHIPGPDLNVWREHARAILAALRETP